MRSEHWVTVALVFIAILTGLLAHTAERVVRLERYADRPERRVAAIEQRLFSAELSGKYPELAADPDHPYLAGDTSVAFPMGQTWPRGRDSVFVHRDSIP